MIKKLYLVPILLAGFLATFGTYHLVHAQSGSGSGSAVVAVDAAVSPDPVPAPTGEAPGAPESKSGVPDPIDDTGGFIGETTSSFQRGAYLNFALLLIFGIVVVAKKYIAWLRVGWRAIAVSVVLSAVTTMILALAQGASPTLAWGLGILGNAALVAINGKGEPAPDKA